MANGIIYLLTGAAHGVRLVVSLWSLRQHYRGPVTLFTTRRASHVIAARCAADRRLRVEHRVFENAPTGRNADFLTKVAILPHSPYEITALVDADTLVSGDVSALFSLAETEGFCATQFADWDTRKRVIRRRLESWRKVGRDKAERKHVNGLVDAALEGQPAVNSGVFAYRRGAEIVGRWQDLAELGRSTFICDEIALQLLLPHYPHKLLDCRYNCSPVYGIRQDDARIWHFHGERHVRDARCRKIWLPAYQACLGEDVAGLARWTPGEDRRLAAWERRGGGMRDEGREVR
ncbi:MAG: hypothetical protein HUU20_26230 [Pirellulales bacterium]|nr:hypothetical protein [Pirellulales bacterium]